MAEVRQATLVVHVFRANRLSAFVLRLQARDAANGLGQGLAGIPAGVADLRHLLVEQLENIGDGQVLLAATGQVGQAGREFLGDPQLAGLHLPNAGGGREGPIVQAELFLGEKQFLAPVLLVAAG
ncbi:MAG: hypothetical protein ACYC3W_12685, partial [Candidatus Nanopelagicales bacterium]